MPRPVAGKTRLLVGLGNPGADYEHTRHNAGFWLVERALARWGGQIRRQSRFFGQIGETSVGSARVRLLMPETHMNNSGRSVAALASYFGVEPEEIAVAHDEIDLPVGTVRIKFGGGPGGHNGLRDIISAIGSRDFVRIRIGVGHPGHRDRVIGHVLKRPSRDERRVIDDTIEEALDVFDLVTRGELEKAMTRLHTDSGAKDAGS